MSPFFAFETEVSILGVKTLSLESPLDLGVGNQVTERQEERAWRQVIVVSGERGVDK